MAAGSEATGFWFALPEHPTGAFLKARSQQDHLATPNRGARVQGQHRPFELRRLHVRPRPPARWPFRPPAAHIALANPADANSPLVETVFEDFTSYKNRNGGIWARGEMDTFKNLKLADNAIGYHACVRQLRPFRLYVTGGRLAVRGRNREHRQPQDAGGNGLRPQLAGARNRGFPDPRLRVLRLPPSTGQCHLREFPGQRHPQDGSDLLPAVHQLRNEHQQHRQRAKFVNAKPVYFPPMEHKWSNDDYGNGSYKTAVFHDMDGSVERRPGLLHPHQRRE